MMTAKVDPLLSEERPISHTDYLALGNRGFFIKRYYVLAIHIESSEFNRHGDTNRGDVSLR